MKKFTLRVDVESERGIKEGIPPLLNLLKKHNIKASFYVSMGGESNILELLKYRKSLESSMERNVSVWSLRDKFRMAFFPKDFVTINRDILKLILEEGHELGIHGWKHREWTRGLNMIDIEKTVDKSVSKYEKLFGKKPISFSAPGFNSNEKVLKILRTRGIKFMSDFPGESVKIYDGIKNIPITITGKKQSPIIEYLVSLGKNDDEIFDEIKEKIINKNIASMYVHCLFEARFKIPLLERIFEFVKKEKIKTRRIIDY
ncbi:TPA: hypothetical protein DIU22_03595 [Candidatus Woesebacteria bacterium]|nr:hypothetical protein [Candidatus Woesebacteria bacterium]HLA23021.1 polysaccharide deacetylase family protein [Candidatus Nanoarchaeia archaeon]